jgi:hypothetical protein
MWRSEKLEPARELLNRILRRRLYKLIGESKVEAIYFLSIFTKMLNYLSASE